MASDQTPHGCRGAEFYHAHHSRRISADEAPLNKSIERAVVRAAGIFGGVEAMGRKMVAQARKQYAERRLTTGQVGERILGLPTHVWPCAKLHVTKFSSGLSHEAMRFIALNIVARLYTKTPVAEIQAEGQ